jgi:hypothetical protein
MSKKSKVGSVDFNVQDSFALGGPAFNVAGGRGADGGKDVKMLTIDPDMHTRLRTLQDTDLRRPRASRSSNRAGPGGMRHDGRLAGSLPPHAESPDGKKDTPASHVPRAQPPTTFENYISRVINSVQHRKKNPRLKSLFTGAHHGALEPYGPPGLEAPGDYGSAAAGQDGLDESQLITQSIMN